MRRQRCCAPQRSRARFRAHCRETAQLLTLLSTDVCQIAARCDSSCQFRCSASHAVGLTALLHPRQARLLAAAIPPAKAQVQTLQRWRCDATRRRPPRPCLLCEAHLAHPSDAAADQCAARRWHGEQEEGLQEAWVAATQRAVVAHAVVGAAAHAAAHVVEGMAAPVTTRVHEPPAAARAEATCVVVELAQVARVAAHKLAVSAASAWRRCKVSALQMQLLLENVMSKSNAAPMSTLET